jgi:glyoxylase-like metal-dependent hydrolase (beta-lactamase superfamily II)
MLQVHSLILGPVATNTYLIADSSTGACVVIDPAWDGHSILIKAKQLGWQIQQAWITHAHFDHFGGAHALQTGTHPPVTLALHPDDLPLWSQKGGAGWFGIQMELPTQPDILLYHGQMLHVGKIPFEVRHTPGHSLGHVVFYCATESLAFCGDTIFANSIGRTDLPGGDEEILIDSIQNQILTLPDHTRLLCGHGDDTTVGIERTTNPFLV